MSGLPYTDSEIVASYRQAKYPKQQVRILADLNATSEKVIKNILEKAGIVIMGKGVNREQIAKLYEQGLSDSEISKAVGVSHETVRQWRIKEGLVSNVAPKRSGAAPRVQASEPQPTPNAAAPEGLKFDRDKPRLELVPPSLYLAVGRVMTFGAQKYADNTWRGVEAERYKGAMLRHAMAYMSGESKDPESGMPHLWHIATNIAFLIELEGGASC